MEKPSTTDFDYLSREAVAAISPEKLDAFAAALAAARDLVDDVRDERTPRSHCGQWDHPGHHWTRYGRSRYCWGDGPFLDREAYGKCGALWPHPAHAMGTYQSDDLNRCPGVGSTD
ncbi:hypothetical protein [Streptomyces cavernae]|uniref:hypothetical protein n=1 Tax=Streptomyces cavernae TaxID=2259034 RepID=UPI000FEC16A1|nr:hypothetical protein [Streptomyces cavernae]